MFWAWSRKGPVCGPIRCHCLGLREGACRERRKARPPRGSASHPERTGRQALERLTWRRTARSFPQRNLRPTFPVDSPDSKGDMGCMRTLPMRPAPPWAFSFHRQASMIPHGSTCPSCLPHRPPHGVPRPRADFRTSKDSTLRRPFVRPPSPLAGVLRGVTRLFLCA
jgi:hypothetical protein